MVTAFYGVWSLSALFAYVPQKEGLAYMDFFLSSHFLLHPLSLGVQLLPKKMCIAVINFYCSVKPKSIAFYIPKKKKKKLSVFLELKAILYSYKLVM